MKYEIGMELRARRSVQGLTKGERYVVLEVVRTLGGSFASLIVRKGTKEIMVTNPHLVLVLNQARG